LDDNGNFEKQANELCAKTWSFSESSFLGDWIWGETCWYYSVFGDLASNSIPYECKFGVSEWIWEDLGGQANLGNFRADLGSAESQKEKVFYAEKEF